jgi:hypothetical protein
MLPFPALQTHPHLSSRTFFDAAAPLFESFTVVKETKSVLGEPIRAFSRGSGPMRILLWTQMHGDESTSTFALADWLYNQNESANETLWQHITLWVIPILNPDGANAYTRHNALGVDLNRDARHLCSPESRFLMDCANTFNPHWAFNMHDQRSIFAAGDTGKPATLALLAPSLPRHFTGSVVHLQRAIALLGSVVSRMPEDMRSEIARFDDTFYPLAMGDFFQEREIATVLIETGGGRDIIRHTGRMRTALFLNHAFDVLLNPSECIWQKAPGAYEDLPENTNALRDIIFTDGRVGSHTIDVAVQLKYNPTTGRWDMICDAVGQLDYLHSYHRIDLSEAPPINESNWSVRIGEQMVLPASWSRCLKSQNISAFAWVNPE